MSGAVHPRLATEVARSLESIDEAEWESIVGPNRLTQRYRYALALSRSHINDCDYRFITVRDEAQQLQAHALVYTITDPLDASLPRGSALARAVRAVRHVAPRFLMARSLECGSPSALGHTLSLHPGLTAGERTEVLFALADAMLALAHEGKAQFLALFDYTREELPDFLPLLERGFKLAPTLERAVLEIRWRSFDAYLGALRSKYRYELLRNRARADAAGVRREYVSDYASHAAEMCRLLEATRQRASDYDREVFGPEYFVSTSRILAERSSATLFWIGTRLVAFVLYFIEDEELLPNVIGVDYAYNEQAALVFGAYYEMVERAIALRKGSVDLGFSTYEPKLKLGARIEPTFMLVRHRHGLLSAATAAFLTRTTPRCAAPAFRVFKQA